MAEYLYQMYLYVDVIKNIHMSTYQSQTKEVDQPSEVSLPLQPPLLLDF